MLRKKRRRQFYPLAIGVVYPLKFSNEKQSLKLYNIKAYWKSEAQMRLRKLSSWNNYDV